MIRLQRVLLGALGAFWLVAGALAVTGTMDFGLTSGAAGLGVFMLGNAAVLIAGAWFSARGRRGLDLALAGYLGMNAILSVTDDVGVLDALSLILSLTLASLVIWNSRSQKRSGDTEGLGWEGPPGERTCGRRRIRRYGGWHR